MGSGPESAIVVVVVFFWGKKRTKRYPHSGAPGPTYQRHSQNAEETKKSAGPAGPSGPPGTIITITITRGPFGVYLGVILAQKCFKYTSKILESSSELSPDSFSATSRISIFECPE